MQEKFQLDFHLFLQDTIVQQEVAKPCPAVWVNTVRPMSFPLPQETVLLAISVMEQPVFPIPGNVTWATTAQRAPQCRWHVPLEHSQVSLHCYFTLKVNEKGF